MPAVTGGGLATTVGWVLAIVFALAAASKLSNPQETIEGFTSMGLRGARFMALTVPFVELGTAVILILAPAVGAFLSLALLVAFTVVLMRVLQRGVVASCACFGAASAHAVSVVDVIRNVALAGAAVVVIVGGEPLLPTVAEMVVVAAVWLVVGAALAGARVLIERSRSSPEAG